MRIFAPGVGVPHDDSELLAAGVNPASEEARELRETGTRPLKSDNKRPNVLVEPEVEGKRPKMSPPDAGTQPQEHQQEGTLEKPEEEQKEAAPARENKLQEEVAVGGKKKVEEIGEEAPQQAQQGEGNDARPETASTEKEDKEEKEKIEGDIVGPGEEAAGLVQLAAERASNATAQAKDKATEAITNAAIATKEAARKVKDDIFHINTSSI